MNLERIKWQIREVWHTLTAFDDDGKWREALDELDDLSAVKKHALRLEKSIAWQSYLVYWSIFLLIVILLYQFEPISSKDLKDALSLFSAQISELCGGNEEGPFAIWLKKDPRTLLVVFAVGLVLLIVTIGGVVLTAALLVASLVFSIAIGSTNKKISLLLAISTHHEMRRDPNGTATIRYKE